MERTTPRLTVTLLAVLLACVAIVGQAFPTAGQRQRRTRTVPALLRIEVLPPPPQGKPLAVCVGQTKDLLVRVNLVVVDLFWGGFLPASPIEPTVTNSSTVTATITELEARRDYDVVEPFKGTRYGLKGLKPGTGTLTFEATLPAGWGGEHPGNVGPQPALHAKAVVDYRVDRCDYTVSTVQTLTARGTVLAMTMDDVRVTADDSERLTGVGVPDWVVRPGDLLCRVRATVEGARPVEVTGQIEEDGTLALDLDHADVSVKMAMRCPRLRGVSRTWTDTMGLSDRHVTMPGDGGAISTIQSRAGHRETVSITVEPVEPEAVAVAGSRLMLAAVAAGPSPTPVVSPAPSGVEVSIEVADGPFDLLDPTVGLADRESYMASLTNAFEGTVAGEPVIVSTTATLRVAPTGRELTIERGPDGPTTWRARVKGFSYAKDGDGPCIAVPVADGESLVGMLEPAAELPPLFGASEATIEAVEGVATGHHTFDESSLVLPGPATATGDVWVAEPDGRVVRYRARVEAGSEVLGDGVAGALSFEYALSTPERDPAIRLPADCPLPVDATVLDDATDIIRRPGMLSFGSPTAVARAVRSYTRQLRDKGWKSTFPAEVTKSTALLGFRKGKRDITVVMRRRNGETRVHVTITR